MTYMAKSVRNAMSVTMKSITISITVSITVSISTITVEKMSGITTFSQNFLGFLRGFIEVLLLLEICEE